MGKKSLFRRYGLQLLLLASVVVFALVYRRVHDDHFARHIAGFQSTFSDKELKLDRLLIYEKHRFEHFGLTNIWERKVDEEFNLHIYRNDSLLFWSTNEMPILRFADIHFPDDGILHLQNGWYYAKTMKVGRVKFCASFLIKKDYAYENKDLENGFARSFELPFEASIRLSEGGYDIFDTQQNYQFTLEPNKKQEISTLESGSLLLLLLFVFVLFLVFLFRSVMTKVGILSQGLIVLLLLLLRSASMQFGWLNFMNTTEAFQPNLYGSNDLFPTFGDFLLNVTLLVFVLRCLSLWMTKSLGGKWAYFSYLLVYFSFFLFWSFLLFVTEGLIENSKIPLEIDQLFQLNAYSLLAIISIGALFHAYYLLLNRCIEILFKNRQAVSTVYVLTFLAGFIYFLFDINYGYQLLFAALYPGLFLFVMLLLHKDTSVKNQFGQGLVLLFLFSICLATNIGVFNDRKERSERELYANQLQTDQDILTEIEFQKIGAKIDSDPFIQKFATKRQNLGVSDFHDALERRLFDNFWEQYDMEYYLFLPDGTPTLENFGKSQAELDTILSKHGLLSEVDPNVYFITDFVEQYAYVYKYKFVNKDGQPIWFYGTFKSKRIPEEIGFPRLLISENAKVFQSLENYSIAKYHKGKLITRYGEYQFPTLISAFKIGAQQSNGYLERGDFNHFFLRHGDGDYIFLSAKNSSWVDLLTTFSYLFCFLGLLVLPMLFRNKQMRMGAYTFTLAMKIQVVMISLVFVSLLIYGWGSGIFVQNQYNEYTNKVISEKLNSVKLEFQGKYVESQKNPYRSENTLEGYLQKFARVFVTDINFYDPKGYLIASSRPRVFNVGLLSEQMNPKAMSAMQVRFESEFVQQETIGKLMYSSAYQPLLNDDGKLLGYLNLQHFGQQKEFEIQIQRFLMAIVNVFMFLLAVSVVVAIFVSGWLTAPLRLLQESFSKVNFGQLNEPILYAKEDEIGALVKEYNQKIDELALKAQQLAQSERESAWREMAKQVAHEIKNPLTPMKLSLQHFQRIYDPEAPVSKEKLQLTIQSLVEQIDGLTRIANEFSNFAKMPNPNEEEVELTSLLKGIIAVFGQSENCTITLEAPNEDIYFMADKDMLVRIFNNILKNAIQASQDRKDATVHVVLEEGEERLYIQIKDNGKGIPADLKTNIFVPYFTTKSTGTGLGLAMVKQMVELHKGTIYFESIEGEGTTFFLEFPRK